MEIGKFEIAFGSVLGQDHKGLGKNNQDSISIINNSKAVIGVVCDGCGSSKYSEVGSRIAANLITKKISESVQRYADCMSSYDIDFELERVRKGTIANLHSLAERMGNSLSTVVNDYFLFTIVGFLITEFHTYVFSIGDGCFAINNVFKTIGPFPNNEPPYLAYEITGSSISNSHLLKFTVNGFHTTLTLESLMIGSDGIVDFRNIPSDTLQPDQKKPIGSLSQFWEEDVYFKNPDMLRRKLGMVNKDVARLERLEDGSCRLRKYKGLLKDDTSLIVVRRRATNTVK